VKINHFFRISSSRDFDRARTGRTTIQHNIPFAEEKVLTVDKPIQVKNFVLVFTLEYARTIHVVMQKIGIKYIICMPKSQFSYWTGEKIKIFEIKRSSSL
jgi:hypothetical protein